MGRTRDDENLVRRAVEGDVEAFGDLYEHYLPEIYRYVFYRVGERQEAEDLTETVFLNVWQALPRFRVGEVSFRSWLYRVAHNLLVDHYRTTKPTIDLAQEMPLQDPSPSPEQQVMDLERQSQIARWLAQLPPDYQQVLTLRFVNGLSHAQAAEVMGRTEGAVRVLQHRALRALRRLRLKEQGHDDQAQ